MLRTALVALLPLVSSMCFAETQAVDIYSQDQLLEMIRGEKYLARVKQDDCQLVQDIEARAEVLKQPLYQFLWGEMLNHGTCVKANAVKGMGLLQEAAEQGSPEAMVKLAEYSHGQCYRHATGIHQQASAGCCHTANGAV